MGEALSPAERAHALPEIRRRILLFLDNAALCVALRSGSELFASAVPILYRCVTPEVPDLVQPGPREFTYLSAVREVNASRPGLTDFSGWADPLGLEASLHSWIYTHEGLSRVCARCCNLRFIRKTSNPFSVGETLTIDCRTKHIQYRKTIVVFLAQKLLGTGPHRPDWNGWTLKETFTVHLVGLGSVQDYQARILDFQRGASHISRVSLGFFQTDLGVLGDICLGSNPVDTLIAYALRPFTLADWAEFATAATNIQYVRLESHLIRRETVEPILTEMLDMVRALPSLRIFEFRLRLGEDEDAPCTLNLHVARRTDGDMQTTFRNRYDFDELCYPP